MDYKVTNGVLNVYFDGDLDHNSAPRFRNTLDGILQKEDYQRIIFDLSKLSFMDSTGVGLIMGRYKTARNLNKIVCIRAPSKGIDKVLTVSGIYNIIPKIV